MFAHPSIKDVAQVAGVHFTTVSMALRGHPSIPAATRDRILAAADRTGYRRNEVFAALTNQRSGGASRYYVPRIAYLANRSPEAGFEERAHNRMLVAAARRQAEALGYRLDVLFVDKGHFDSSSLLAHLREHAIRGLIIGAFEPGRGELELDWSEFCTVKIDSRHLPLDVAFVSNDQMAIVRQAFRQMRALGYRRVGLAVDMDCEQSTDDMHLAAWLDEQQGIPRAERVPALIFPHDASHREAVPLLKKWIPANGVDAVLCNWTNIRRMVGMAGYDCPREVACACLCLTRPMAALAGVVANLDLVGQRVVSLLAALLRSEQRGLPDSATSTFVEGYWHDGTSAPKKS